MPLSRERFVCRAGKGAGMAPGRLAFGAGTAERSLIYVLARTGCSSKAAELDDKEKKQ